MFLFTWCKSQFVEGTFNTRDLISRIETWPTEYDYTDVIEIALDELNKDDLKAAAKAVGIGLKCGGKRLSADDLRQELMHLYFSSM